MIQRLRDRSIKKKLNGLVTVTAGVATLLCCGAFVVKDAMILRESKVRQLSALASVVGQNSTAALTFNVPSNGTELLSSLGKQPAIKFACLYNEQGKVFATYGDTAWDIPPPRPPGNVFTADNHLDVTERIEEAGVFVGTIYLRARMDDLQKQFSQNVLITALVLIVSMAAAVLLSSRLQRGISLPILRLADTAQTISSSGDYSIRVRTEARDELGTLYDEFNGMLDRIARGEKELQDTQQRLVDTARQAGMAEVATGVLHNVGNVLNSINVSAALITDRLRQSRLPRLRQTVELISQHQGSLEHFFGEDEKGKRLPSYLAKLADHLDHEHELLLDELAALGENLDHVKTIVAMQQSYAGVGGMEETISLAELIDDALKLNADGLRDKGIQVVRNFAELPPVRLDKHRLLQVLVNLLTNARDAVTAGRQDQRRIVIRTTEPSDERVRIEVSDNGIGIPKENLTRIFSHGFTSKRHGHGFGLHTAANAIQEMEGHITAASGGPGQGATFAIELPFVPALEAARRSLG
jgi:two-component system NtrC family sensor kinase